MADSVEARHAEALGTIIAAIKKQNQAYDRFRDARIHEALVLGGFTRGDATAAGIAKADASTVYEYSCLELAELILEGLRHA